MTSHDRRLEGQTGGGVMAGIRWPWWCSAGAAVLVTSCSTIDEPPPAAPASVQLTSGDHQTGVVAVPLIEPLVVEVWDAAGNALPGVSVNWFVAAGGGTVTSTVPTDGSGRSAVTFVLGKEAGTDNNVVRATVAGLESSPVVFTASAVADEPSVLRVVSGNAQSARVQSMLTDSVVVLVTDHNDNPVSTVVVRWTVVAGGGSVAAASSNSDERGLASAAWTLGTVAGPGSQVLTASSGGLTGSPVTFTANANPANATVLTLVSGEGQAGIVGKALSDPFVVQALDEYDNPVEGVTVDWTIDAGGGSPSTGVSVTGVNGQGSMRLTLGTVAGVDNQVVQAAFGGMTGPPVVFTAGAGPDIPNVLTVVSGDAQSAPVAAQLAAPLVVEVDDRFGNPVPGADIAWAVAAGGGTVTDSSVVADADGLATVFWSVGTAAGVDNNTVTASVAGSMGIEASFVASASPGPAAEVALDGGDGQVGAAGSTLPIPYGVVVTDAFGNPVPGANVVWVVGIGGGTVSDDTTATDVAGVAAVLRVLGPSAGQQTAVASVQGLSGSPLTFMATSIASALISGTITLDIGAHGVASRVPAGRSTPGSPGAWAVRSPRDLTVPGELIVTYHAPAIAAPPIGATSAAFLTNIPAVSASILDHLSVSEPANELSVVAVSAVLHAARVRVSDPSRLDAVASALRRDPAVRSVSRHGIAISHGLRTPRRVRATLEPDDPLLPWQAWHYDMIDLPEAWPVTTGSASVLVAVIDDGIRFDHPWISPNLTSDGFDFVTDSQIFTCGGTQISFSGDNDGPDPNPEQPQNWFWDFSLGCAQQLKSSGNHGLHVAGTIGAVGNDALGVTGVNWNVRIRPVRALGVTGFGSFWDIAQSVLYSAGLPVDTGSVPGTMPLVQAAVGADIINMSLGGSANDVVLQNAIVAASATGALIIASAGNTASSQPDYPAAYPEVISVSALGPDGLLASYSSFGPTIEMSAPGGDLNDGGLSFGVTSTTWNYLAGSMSWDQWHGTSMAAPHVAGVAALVLANNPSLSAGALRLRLANYSLDAGPPGRDPEYGYGIVNARNSVTETLAPPRQLYAQLRNTADGSIEQTVAVDPFGTYSFSQVADGSYYVYAGEDEDGDQVIGTPGRRWGAFGGSAVPTPVTVLGVAVYTASFTTGFPVEREPNDNLAGADELQVGGYLAAYINSAGDIDVARVLVPLDGIYTFETEGVGGACGFALEEDTQLTLLDEFGATIDSNDDIDPSALNLCSRIQQTLTAGTYYLQVEGSNQGRYRVSARAGT